ncbi:MAG: GNAT family N-acetyltransferase [Candidatus Margulisiibacteriota bacterium]
MDYTFEKIKGLKNIDEMIKLRRDIFIKEDGYPEEALASEFDKEAVHFLAKKGDKLIGSITVVMDDHKKLPIEKFVDLNKFREKPLAELQKLAVLPGERKGFVSLGLMVLAYEHAKESGAKRIVIFSLDKKKENVELYKKFGFKVIDKFDFYGVGEANAMIIDLDDTAIYEKDNKNSRRANLVQKLSGILKI